MNNDFFTVIKLFCTTVIAYVSAKLGLLYPIMICLFFAMIADLQLEVDKVHCCKYRERHFDLIRFFYQIKGGIIDELR